MQFVVFYFLHLKFQLHLVSEIAWWKYEPVKDAFLFLIAKHSRNLYTSDENSCFDLKTLFKECECEAHTEWKQRHWVKEIKNKALERNREMAGGKSENEWKSETVIFFCFHSCKTV